jgi:hypothetical protein
MTDLTLPFPFWLLVARGETPWRPVTLTPGYAAAFSTHTRACEFLTASANPAWEVRLVVRTTMVRMADEFRRQGVTGVEIDAGSGEETRVDLDVPAELV